MSGSSKLTAKISGLTPQDITRSHPSVFSEALSKIALVPHAEMKRRLDSSPKESASHHKRHKYVPAKPQSNSENGPSSFPVKSFHVNLFPAICRVPRP
jgi:hypothetical protein